jgi:hypothetical protein
VLRDGVARLERINALPKPPGDGRLAVESFIHGFYGNVFYGYARGVDAEEKQNAILDEVQGMLAAGDKMEAAQQMLPQIAQKYAAKPSNSQGRILVDIDGSWGSVGSDDWLSIYNVGQDDLVDCTIQVVLIAESGETHKNVHFVRHWPSRSWMEARYSPGKEIGDRPEALKTTVRAIQEADVSIWSPKFTTRLNFIYHGPEKDKDVARYCEDLKFTGRYQPFVSGLVRDTERGAEFTLDGLNYIPKCRVDLRTKLVDQIGIGFQECPVFEGKLIRGGNTCRGTQSSTITPTIRCVMLRSIRRRGCCNGRLLHGSESRIWFGEWRSISSGGGRRSELCALMVTSA